MPEKTAMSNTAGPCRCQLGSQTSAGRRPPPQGCSPSSGPPWSSGSGGRRVGFSTSGWRPAVFARPAKIFQSWWCRLTRSPPQGQTRAWSPNLSQVPSQRGQGVSESDTGKRSRKRTMVRKSGVTTWSPKAVQRAWQLLLSDTLRGWDREVVGRRKGHVHQVESSIEVRVVAWIHIFPQWRSSPQRSSVVGDTVPGHAAEPEPTTPSGKCYMEPRFRSEGPVASHFEAASNNIVKRFQGGPSPSGRATLMD